MIQAQSPAKRYIVVDLPEQEVVDSSRDMTARFELDQHTKRHLINRLNDASNTPAVNPRPVRTGQYP